MLRPRWILSLLLALAIAAAFAWLGQWQLSRAIDRGSVGPEITETSHALGDVITPGVAIHTDRVGQLVSAELSFVPGDYSILTGRVDLDQHGYWIVGHATLAEKDAAGNPVELAVARGFTASRSEALSIAHRLNAQPAQPVALTGRLLPTEPPEQPEDNEQGTPPTMNDMSVATLINLWHSDASSDYYEAYVVEHNDVPAGLTAIYSPSPETQETINWLNIFYAAEWVVFAGFAIYLWYRLVKDTWEREVDDAREALENEKVD